MADKIEEFKKQLQIVEGALKIPGLADRRESLLKLKENLILILSMAEEAFNLEKNVAANELESESTTEPSLKKEDDETTTEPSFKKEDDEPTTEPSLKKEDDETTTEPSFKKEDDEPTTEPSLKKEDDETTTEPSFKKEDDEPTTEPSFKKEDDEPTTEPSLKEEDDEDATIKKLLEIKNNLSTMIGVKCSAPYTSKSRGTTFYNAIICGLDETKTEWTLEDVENIRVRVFFSNPTEKKMVPCTYFLENVCEFNNKCQYSHGELVPYHELQEYQFPEFTKLTKNCEVLVKMEDRIWHRGIVLGVNFDEQKCSVKINTKHCKVGVKFEDLFPLTKDSGGNSSSSDSEIESNEIRNDTATKTVDLKSQFSYQPSQPLGEWEKNTKGIGSKLMAKMGYINGMGLGVNGEGIIEPITAQILPPRRSLDYCMEYRNKANDELKNFLKTGNSITKFLEKREKPTDNYFSTLNDMLAVRQNTLKFVFIRNHNDIYSTLTRRSTKELNVDTAKVSNNIRNIKKQIADIKIALRRQPNGTQIIERYQQQLAEKEAELNTLRRSESLLTAEKNRRKEEQRLSEF